MDVDATVRTISETDFKRISSVIETRYGIKMPPEKKVLLESRLIRRLRVLHMQDYTQYFSYLFEQKGLEKEIVDLMDVVSTNKTDFFRESAHFDYLVSEALPEILSRYSRNTRKVLKVWSAACSSGEEPYTLAMVLNEWKEVNRLNYPLFDYMVLATDISTVKLEEGTNAVYHEENIIPIPEKYRRKYLLKSRDEQNMRYRIVPGIRQKVVFHRLNLMDEIYPIVDLLDVIFCRNVMIYFQKETQNQIVWKFSKNLAPGGYLFIGHSETLINMDVPYFQKAPTVYQVSGRPNSGEI